MSFEHPFSESRQVIPRWHTYPVARWLGLAQATVQSGPPHAPTQDFVEKIQAWRNQPNPLYASDLVGSALSINQVNSRDATDAAQYILEHDRTSPSSVVELANAYLRQVNRKALPLPNIILPEQTAKFHEAIASLKGRVRAYPRNPILWMELAFYYSAIGQKLSAEKAVNVAISLNKENRYLLRSGSRFFMHMGLAEQGLELIRRSESGRHDPWLVAAEIAISNTLGLAPKRINRGRELLASSRIDKFHLSELASALGTLELENGAIKKGKRLFTLALEDPTENSLAQAAHLSDVLGETARHIGTKHLANSFEAETSLKFYQDEDYRGALEAAKKWFAYQPFSSRPALSGSYIAAVTLDDHEEAIRITKMGLLSSPNDVMLRNNLAFSLASLNRPGEAREALSHIKESDLEKRELAVVTATKALVDFRIGNLKAARKLYADSIAGFKQVNDARAEIMARFFWTREERLANPNLPEHLLQEILKSAAQLGIKGLHLQQIADKQNETLF